MFNTGLAGATAGNLKKIIHFRNLIDWKCSENLSRDFSNPYQNIYNDLFSTNLGKTNNKVLVGLLLQGSILQSSQLLPTQKYLDICVKLTFH